MLKVCCLVKLNLTLEYQVKYNEILLIELLKDYLCYHFVWMRTHGAYVTETYRDVVGL